MDKVDRIVIFDIDGTILLEQSQLLLIKYLYKNKIVGRIFFLKLYVWFILYKLGIMKDPKKVFEHAIAFLRGKHTSWADDILSNFVLSVLSNYFLNSITTLIRDYIDKGDRVILLSNAMDVLVKHIAKYLDVNEYIGTKLEIKEDIFTGKLAGHINYGSEKVKKLRNLSFKYDTSAQEQIIFYTDHHSDLDLLSKVDVPVVVNPTKILRKIAIEKGWRIMDTK